MISIQIWAISNPPLCPSTLRPLQRLAEWIQKGRQWPQTGPRRQLDALRVESGPGLPSSWNVRRLVEGWGDMPGR